MASLRDYIEMFNDGEWDEFSNIFGGRVEPFLKLLSRRGLLSEIEVQMVDDRYPELTNEVMLTLLEHDPSYINYIVGLLSDVSTRDGGYYLELRDLEELSEFFKDNSNSRNYNDRDVVKNVLGEDWWDPYYDTVYNVYNDIIKVLNDKNITELATYIIEKIGNKELKLSDYRSSSFEDFSIDDENFIITESNVRELIDNQDAMEELLKGDLSELSSNMRGLGDEAYNYAYNDMVFDEVMNELSTLFEGKHEWDVVKRGERTLQKPFIKIRDLKGNIVEFLNTFKNHNYTLFYYDNYTAMMDQLMQDTGDFLTIGLSDYPDHRKVEEYINEGFPDRLYW